MTTVAELSLRKKKFSQYLRVYHEGKKSNHPRFFNINAEL